MFRKFFLRAKTILGSGRASEFTQRLANDRFLLSVDALTIRLRKTARASTTIAIGSLLFGSAYIFHRVEHSKADTLTGLEEEFDEAMTDWLNANDKDFFKSRLENPVFVAQLKETEGIEDQKALFALIKVLESGKLDSEKSEKVIETFRELLVKVAAERMNTILEDELTLGLAKTKGVAYFVNYIKAHGDLSGSGLIFLRRLSRYSEFQSDIAKSQLLSYLLLNLRKLHKSHIPLPKVRKSGKKTEKKEPVWESTNVNFTPKLEMHVSFVPESMQAEEEAIHNERRMVSLILRLTRNEEAVKSAIYEVGGIRSLITLLTEYRNNTRLEPVALAVICACVFPQILQKTKLHQSKTFREEITTLGRDLPSSLALENALPRLIGVKSVDDRLRMIMKVVEASRSIPKAKVKFDAPDLEGSRRLFAALYAFSCWFFVLSRISPSTKALGPALVAAMPFTCLSVVAANFSHQFPAQMKVYRRQYVDPSNDISIPQRRQYMLGLDMVIALERVAALHFFRFSFLPSVLSGESLNNLFKRFDQE